MSPADAGGPRARLRRASSDRAGRRRAAPWPRGPSRQAPFRLPPPPSAPARRRGRGAGLPAPPNGRRRPAREWDSRRLQRARNGHPHQGASRGGGPDEELPFERRHALAHPGEPQMPLALTPLEIEAGRESPSVVRLLHGAEERELRARRNLRNRRWGFDGEPDTRALDEVVPQ